MKHCHKHMMPHESTRIDFATHYTMKYICVICGVGKTGIIMKKTKNKRGGLLK